MDNDDIMTIIVQHETGQISVQFLKKYKNDIINYKNMSLMFSTDDTKNSFIKMYGYIQDNSTFSNGNLKIISNNLFSDYKYFQYYVYIDFLN